MNWSLKNMNVQALGVATLSISICLASGGCTGNGDTDRPDEGSTSSAESSGTASDGGSVDIRDLKSKVLADAPADSPPVIASATAVQGTADPTVELKIDIYNVVAGVDSTYVSWGVSAPGGPVSGSQLRGNLGGVDIPQDQKGPFSITDYPRGSAALAQIFDPKSNSTYWPLQRPVGYHGDSSSGGFGCLCSGVPEHITEEPYLMNGLCPVLPAGVTEVSFVLPDFPAIENIPVTRVQN